MKSFHLLNHYCIVLPVWLLLVFLPRSQLTKATVLISVLANSLIYFGALPNFFVKTGATGMLDTN